MKVDALMHGPNSSVWRTWECKEDNGPNFNPETGFIYFTAINEDGSTKKIWLNVDKVEVCYCRK